jgi:hypothetical protein
MAWAHVNAYAEGAPALGGTWTSAAQDTTGADFIIIEIGYDAGGTPVVSDNKGNTNWQPLTSYLQGSVRGRFVYHFNAVSGTGHTFTFTGAAAYAGASIAWYSGGGTTDPFDTGTDTGAGSTGTTANQGASQTPSQNDCLVVAGLGIDGIATTASINGGFTIRASVDLAGSSHYGSAIADLIQTTAAAADPDWTIGVASPAVAMIAVFKAAGASAATPPVPVSRFRRGRRFDRRRRAA